MKNYSKIEKQEGARIELHGRLGLTGSEISIDELPAEAAVPFVHAHKENEEVYYIVKGVGTFAIDGEEVALKEGDFIKIAPKGKRQIFAGESGITYLCFQTKASPLEQYTAGDAVIC